MYERETQPLTYSRAIGKNGTCIHYCQLAEKDNYNLKSTGYSENEDIRLNLMEALETS